MTDITAEIQEALKRVHRAFGSWAKAGHLVLGIDPGQRGLSWLIAHGKRRPTPSQTAHFCERFTPILDALPDPKDPEQVADRVWGIISTRVGRENGVTARQLGKALMVPLWRIYQAVTVLRLRDLLVLGGRTGFYLPANPNEVHREIAALEAHRSALERTIGLLRATQRSAFPISFAVVEDSTHSLEAGD